MKLPLFLLLLVAACASPSDDPLALPSASIVLDAYSGQPNPRWNATPAELTELNERLQDLPDADAHAIPEHLGYRGFYIHGPDATARMYVTRGYVLFMENGRVTRTARDQHDVRAALELQATSRGYGDVVRSPVP
jgi:hypothetical protein